MRTLTIRKFLTEQEQVNWLVTDLLPDVGWTLLYSERGSGKTTFAIQLCMALEQGTLFLGLPTKKARTLYIQADSVADEWRAILQRVCPEASAGYTSVDVPERCLGNPQYIVDLKDAVKRSGSEFIVFDSLYNLASKPVNNEGVLDDINSMKAIAQGHPWLLIHHPPHGEARAAGSNSIGGNCSNDWMLLKGKLKINKGRLVKQKDLSLGRDFDGRWIAKREEQSDPTYTDILARRIPS